jgi:hypothetical protein
MTNEHIDTAIASMRTQCRIALDNDYQMLSARRALELAGYDDHDIQPVLEDIAARGFWYCLDPSIEHQHSDSAIGSHPPKSACVWGPDQLLSRLDSLQSR